MIGLVIITHGNLAVEMRCVLEHVVGPQEQIETISIEADEKMESRVDDIKNAIEATNSGEGVIVLTDMFGGTPSNMAISVMQEGSVEVIAGINMPLLVKLASARKCGDLAEAASAAQEAGRKYIQVASTLINGV